MGDFEKMQSERKKIALTPPQQSKGISGHKKPT